MTPKTKSVTKSKAANKKTARTNRATPKITTAKLVWRDVACRVRTTPNYISKGWTHIELLVVTPKGAPLPITSTGYLSHFLDDADLKRAGGAVAFFSAWIEREAATKAWAKAEFKWRQLELAFGE